MWRCYMQMQKKEKRLLTIKGVEIVHELPKWKGKKSSNQDSPYMSLQERKKEWIDYQESSDHKQASKKKKENEW